MRGNPCLDEKFLELFRGARLVVIRSAARRRVPEGRYGGAVADAAGIERAGRRVQVRVTGRRIQVRIGRRRLRGAVARVPV